MAIDRAPGTTDWDRFESVPMHFQLSEPQQPFLKEVNRISLVGHTDLSDAALATSRNEMEAAARSPWLISRNDYTRHLSISTLRNAAVRPAPGVVYFHSFYSTTQIIRGDSNSSTL